MRNNGEIRLQKIVATVCATIFAAFSFLFVAQYQSPLLEIFYDHVATGKLAYNNYVVASIVSLSLTLVAIWLNKIAKFQQEWTAMAYLPSALVLAFVTDIDRTIYTGGGSFLAWIIIFVLGMFVYMSFSFVLQRVLFEKIKNMATSINRILWRNLILFVLMFLLVGTLSNGEENLKREAKIMTLYKKGDMEGAMKVGYKSLHTSPQLMALRAYILESSVGLGERLFEYPMTYGIRGLLPGIHQNSPLIPDSIYAMLGAKVTEGEDVMAFLSRAASDDSATTAAKNYYLSALLLDRRLPEFKEKVLEFHGDKSLDLLPKHYREALLLYSTFDEGYSLELKSDTLFQLYDSLKRIESKYNDILLRNNYVRKCFGRTYWWYFLYGM